jgi:predicted Rossmann fold flavoprotein
MRCDWQPDVNPEQLRQRYTQLIKTNPKQSIQKTLSEIWPKRFVELFLNEIGIEPTIKSAEFGKTALNQLVDKTKNFDIPIEGVYGFKKAEVTAGGVALSEIDSSSMQSKICDGLFFAGEVMDLDGPIGGYNFQAAFSTGWLAGMCS